MNALLRTESLSKRFDDHGQTVSAVHDVSISVRKGETILLRGPSGCGKTTLLSMLGGLLLPSSGRVLLDGEDIAQLREHHRTELRRKRIGLVLQSTELFSRASALENVLLPTLAFNGPTPAHAARAEAMLADLGLSAHARRDVQLLSGGEQQRVALARALIADPAVLLFDEPTAHLDDASVRAFVTLLASVTARTNDPRTLVIATHDARLAQAMPYAREIVMSQGRLQP